MCRATTRRPAWYGPVRVNGPQPGDVVGAQGAEERDDVPPGVHERSWRGVAVAPRVPGGVHLVAEADDHGAAEVPDALGIRTQVTVVAARRDPLGSDEGGVHLHQHECAVPAECLRVRRRKGSYQPLKHSTMFAARPAAFAKPRPARSHVPRINAKIRRPDGRGRVRGSLSGGADWGRGTGAAAEDDGGGDNHDADHDR